MANIVVSAHEPIEIGTIVTGFLVARHKPVLVYPCNPVPLSRIYTVFGRLRAETDTPPSKHGFGILIGKAEITNEEIEAGYRLWLRIIT